MKHKTRVHKQKKHQQHPTEVERKVLCVLNEAHPDGLTTEQVTERVQDRRNWPWTECTCGRTA